MKLRIILTFHFCGDSIYTGSTLSVGIVTCAEIVQEVVQEDFALAASARDGRNSVAAAMLNIFPKFELVPIRMYFRTLPNALRPSIIPPSPQNTQPVLEENDVRRIPSYIDGAYHRVPTSAACRDGASVDPVAKKTDHVAAGFQHAVAAVLLARQHATTKAVGFFGDMEQGGIRHALQVRTDTIFDRTYSDPLAYMLRHQFVVASEYLDSDAVRPQRRDGIRELFRGADREG